MHPRIRIYRAGEPDALAEVLVGGTPDAILEGAVRELGGREEAS